LFVLLTAAFKKERNSIRHREQEVQVQIETARNYQGGLEWFVKLMSTQEEVMELTRDILVGTLIGSVFFHLTEV
jgi:hypothetical protein